MERFPFLIQRKRSFLAFTVEKKLKKNKLKKKTGKNPTNKPTKTPPKTS